MLLRLLGLLIIAKAIASEDYGGAAKHVDYFAPAHYAYSYGVEDSNTGDYKMHKEERIGDAVKGEYRLTDADGSIRTVAYTADKKKGFQAIVRQSESFHEDRNSAAADKFNAGEYLAKSKDSNHNSYGDEGNAKTILRGGKYQQSVYTPNPQIIKESQISYENVGKSGNYQQLFYTPKIIDGSELEINYQRVENGKLLNSDGELNKKLQDFQTQLLYPNHGNTKGTTQEVFYHPLQFQAGNQGNDPKVDSLTNVFKEQESMPKGFSNEKHYSVYNPQYFQTENLGNGQKFDFLQSVVKGDEPSNDENYAESESQYSPSENQGKAQKNDVLRSLVKGEQSSNEKHYSEYQPQYYSTEHQGNGQKLDSLRSGELEFSSKGNHYYPEFNQKASSYRSFVADKKLVANKGQQYEEVEAVMPVDLKQREVSHRYEQDSSIGKHAKNPVYSQESYGNVLGLDAIPAAKTLVPRKHLAEVFYGFQTLPDQAKAIAGNDYKPDVGEESDSVPQAFYPSKKLQEIYSQQRAVNGKDFAANPSDQNVKQSKEKQIEDQKVENQETWQNGFSYQRFIYKTTAPKQLQDQKEKTSTSQDGYKSDIKNEQQSESSFVKQLQQEKENSRNAFSYQRIVNGKDFNKVNSNNGQTGFAYTAQNPMSEQQDSLYHQSSGNGHAFKMNVEGPIIQGNEQKDLFYSHLLKTGVRNSKAKNSELYHQSTGNGHVNHEQQSEASFTKPIANSFSYQRVANGKGVKNVELVYKPQDFQIQNQEDFMGNVHKSSVPDDQIKAVSKQPQDVNQNNHKAFSYQRVLNGQQTHLQLNFHNRNQENRHRTASVHSGGKGFAPRRRLQDQEFKFHAEMQGGIVDGEPRQGVHPKSDGTQEKASFSYQSVVNGRGFASNLLKAGEQADAENTKKTSPQLFYKPQVIKQTAHFSDGKAIERANFRRAEGYFARRNLNFHPGQDYSNHKLV